MNFVKSTHKYESTDGTHSNNQGFQQRQGFGGGGQQGMYNGPGPWPQNFNGPRGGFSRPPGHFGKPGGFNQRFSTPRSGGQQWQSSGGGRQGLGSDTQGQSRQAVTPSSYSGFVKPERQEDQYEGGDVGSTASDMSQTNTRPFSAPSVMRHPYSSPRFPSSTGARMSGRFGSGGEGGGPMRAGGRGFGRGTRFGDGGGKGTANDNFSGVEAATAAAARATREATNPNVKCIVLASSNSYLTKFKRLAEEIKKLKSKRPNAIDTIHSAANIARVSIQSEIESGPIVKGTGTFFCLVQLDNVNISCCTGLNKRSAKVEAFEVALQKLNKPFQRVVEIEGGTKELQASDYDFSAQTPKQTVIKPTSNVVADISGDGGDSLANSIQKESNVEALVDIRKKNYIAKELPDFVLVEPQEHNSSVNGASILRRSADFSKMLLEYDFAAFGTSGNVRCVVKVEGQVVADVIAYSKMASKIEASQKAVDKLREQCWTILTKQVHDSNAPEITKEEMFDDLASCVTSSNSASMTTPIGDNNLGKKLLQKMGWRGGGIGKDGAGIEEPVTMKQVINREGLGLDAKRGISSDFRTRVTELLESYAASERQDDLVFSPHFRKDERIIIHNECRRLNLKSKSNGQGNTRYLIVRRKRSAYQLLDHVMRCGGETARYKVVPPGERKYPWRPTGSSVGVSNSGASKTASIGGSQSGSGAQSKPALMPSPGQGARGLSPGTSGQSAQGPSAAGKGKSHTGQSPSGAAGQSRPGLLGQNPAGMMGQNSMGMGQNSTGVLGQKPAGMMGQKSMGMMGQNSMGMMGQNLLGMMGQKIVEMMGQNPGMMGQNPGMMGQNSMGMMGQNLGMMGQYPAGMVGQTSAGMMGQNSMGMMGQNSAGMMGQNSTGMMGQNSMGMVGQSPAGMMGQNSAGVMGQHFPSGTMGQNHGLQG